MNRKILNGEIKNNRDTYLYTMDEGHICKHASDEIKKMKMGGLITYDAKAPKVNYVSAIQKGEIVTFHILDWQ